MFSEIKTIAFRCAFAVVAAIFLSIVSCRGASAQEITQFHSQLQITHSGNVEAIENLKIAFPQNSQRTQFYRILPIWYEPDGKAHLVNVNLRSVLMDGDQPIPFQCWASGREIYIKIGDQEKAFRGEHSFKLDYEILRAVHFINGSPRLDLSVTGEACPFPIDRARVDVTLPNGTDVSRVKAAITSKHSQSGIQGPSNGTVSFSAQNIKPGEGLSIRVDMPNGTVVPPSVLYELVLYLQRSYQIFVLPLATIIVLSAWWWFYGRDPRADKETAAHGWALPDFITPAEAGTVIDESCDLVDLVSTLIDLSVRGFISIRVMPYNGFLYLSNRDYEFTLLKSPKDRELKPHEQLFLVGLFGMSTTSYISAIKGTFAEYLPLMKRRVYASLVAEKMLARDPEIDRKNFVAVGAGVITVGVGLMVASTYHLAGQASAFGTVLSGIIIAFAAGAMPRRTSKGVLALRQLFRFRSKVLSGNKAELEKLAKDNPEDFSRYLPYAIVLGCADRWAATYVDTIKDYPNWYQVDSHLLPPQFNSINFVMELGESLSIINRALTEKSVKQIDMPVV